jgi:hypothetical protein
MSPILVNPRSMVMSGAKGELAAFLRELMEKHDLTPAEYINLLAGEIKSITHSAIKTERQVEANVKTIADDLRKATSQPYTGEPFDKNMCKALMTAKQHEYVQLEGRETYQCCHNHGERCVHSSNCSCKCHD